LKLFAFEKFVTFIIMYNIPC